MQHEGGLCAIATSDAFHLAQMSGLWQLRPVPATATLFFTSVSQNSVSLSTETAAAICRCSPMFIVA